MKRERLIKIDNLFYPIYWIFKSLKSIYPRKNVAQSNYVILKFFGLGSITRIVSVIEDLGIDKETILFISIERNESILKELGVNCIPIKTNNAFVLFGSALRTIWMVWRMKDKVVLDMERKANLSALFSSIVSIGKPRISFSFAPENSSQQITLKNKSASVAIAEMFGLTLPKDIPKTSVNDSSQIIVNVNAGDYLAQRRFPLLKFADLIQELSREFPDYNYVLTGTEQEVDRVHEFEQLLLKKNIAPEKIKNVAGAQNLKEFIQCAKGAELLITNDSGPLHLAHYNRVKTVGIWGPTAANLVGYPDSKGMLNIKSTKNCSPCFIHPKSKVAAACNGEVTCFKEMQVKEMANRIKDFILAVDE